MVCAQSAEAGRGPLPAPLMTIGAGIFARFSANTPHCVGSGIRDWRQTNPISRRGRQFLLGGAVSARTSMAAAHHLTLLLLFLVRLIEYAARPQPCVRSAGTKPVPASRVLMVCEEAPVRK